MTYFFKGFQYRESTEKNQSFKDTGEDWLDIPERMTSFPAHTQIRMKPVTTYSISSGLNTIKLTDEEIAKITVRNLITNRTPFSVSIADSPPKFTLEHLQYRQKDAANPEWRPTSIGMPVRYTYATEFRIRPDHYHVVNTLDSVVKGSVAFHDIEDLAAYVDNRLRTNGLDFEVKKVKYGV